MKRLAITLALIVTAAACTQGARDFGKGPPLRPAADPSAVIAAELAFSQLAQTKGQWTAFLDTAAPEAEMFAPQRVKAAEWLKGRVNPPVPVKWQPHAVWSSCDGSYAVTRGAWERPGSAGSFATVWQRQGNGGYKWLLDMSLANEQVPGPPEMIAASVAECPKGATAKGLVEAAFAQRAGEAAARYATDASKTAAKGSSGPDFHHGRSDDMTLFWESNAGETGARRFTVQIWDGRQFNLAIDTGVTPRSP